MLPFLAGINSPFAGEQPAEVIETTDYGEDQLPAKVVAETLKILEEWKLKKFKREQLESRMLDRDETIASLQTLLIRVRNRLQAAPVDVTLDVPPEFRDAVRYGLEKRIAEVLTEMSQWYQRQTGESSAF